MENHIKYSKGLCWIGDCRIPFVDEGDTTINHNTQPGSFVGSFGSSETIYKENTQGRFTPNLLVCDDMLNDGSVSEAKANLNYKWNNTDGGGDIFSNRGTYTPRNDKGSSSRYYDLDKWFDKIIKEL